MKKAKRNQNSDSNISNYSKIEDEATKSLENQKPHVLLQYVSNGNAMNIAFEGNADDLAQAIGYVLLSFLKEDKSRSSVISALGGVLHELNNDPDFKIKDKAQEAISFTSVDELLDKLEGKKND